MKGLIWIGGFSVLVFELMLLGSPAFGGGGVGKFGTGGTGAYANFSDSIVTHLFRGDTLESRTTALVLKGTFHAGDTLGILMDGNTKVGYIDTLGNVYGLAFRGYNGKAVRLTKNGSALDADTAFTVRDNGGTLLLWQDTLGTLRSPLVDTLKAKVVATTAMSEYGQVFNPMGGGLSLYTDWTTYVFGGYAVVANKEAYFHFPLRMTGGAKVVIDSFIVNGIYNKTTDTLQLGTWKMDSLSAITTTLSTKFVGAGSRVAFRAAIGWNVADTLNNVSGFNKGAYMKVLTGIADTVRVHSLKFKYHTIP